MLCISHLQQICSRQLWRHISKNMENKWKRKCYSWIKLKTLWQMEKLLLMSNFSFCFNVFKSHLLQVRQNAFVCGKGLRLAFLKYDLYCFCIEKNDKVQFKCIHKSYGEVANLVFQHSNFHELRILADRINYNK